MRTITVKGVGRASAKPDLVVLSMDMETVAKEYDKAMEYAVARIELLSSTLCEIGFAKDALKTTDFDVDVKRESVKDKDGNYKSVFLGYACRHGLKLEFDMDSKRLGEVLNTISESLADPSLSVEFTVKNPSAVSAELLRSATQNAREKAEILCSAAGVKLGALVAIDYNWTDISFRSSTSYNCMPRLVACKTAMDITPDDIDVSDNATFVWEIE